MENLATLFYGILCCGHKTGLGLQLLPIKRPEIGKQLKILQEKTTPSTHISRLLGGKKKLQTMLTQQAQRDKNVQFLFMMKNVITNLKVR